MHSYRTRLARAIDQTFPARLFGKGSR